MTDTYTPWRRVGFTLWERKSLTRNHYQYLLSPRGVPDEDAVYG
jgi:hypothetical protein